ncbi:MAG: GNAT family N-acetyltransferase [Desulfobulbaceae bacterium]|nr:GNAT family N-acetyltransferase [Desulfobulbaceae bacterium]
MIRAFKPSDMNDVLDIWLRASIEAHSFVSREFWEDKIEDMETTFIPASDTYVFIDIDFIKGFFSLHGTTLAAMFVSPNFQGNGIGQRLMGKAKSIRDKLSLTVYKENPRSIDFYRKCGFIKIKEQVDEHTGHVEILMRYC